MLPTDFFLPVSRLSLLDSCFPATQCILIDQSLRLFKVFGRFESRAIIILSSVVIYQPPISKFVVEDRCFSVDCVIKCSELRDNNFIVVKRSAVENYTWVISSALIAGVIWFYQIVAVHLILIAVFIFWKSLTFGSVSFLPDRTLISWLSICSTYP